MIYLKYESLMLRDKFIFFKFGSRNFLKGGVMKKLSLSAMLLCALFSSSFGWDGERQGFIWGVGAGVDSYSELYIDAQVGDRYVLSVLLPIRTARIGYAWDNRHAFVLHSTQFSGGYNYTAANYLTWKEETAQSNSWYGGAGILLMSPSVVYKEVDPEDSSLGFGLNFGYGYEFAKHMQIDLNFVMGYINQEDSAYDAYTDTRITVEDPTVVSSMSVTFSGLGY
jgi:hypothetical protein